MLNRRDFLIATTATAGLVGCSSIEMVPEAAGRGSYIDGVVLPENQNVVVLWTDRMLQAVADKNFNPPAATRGLSICHVAGFEAANAIEQKYQSLLTLPPAPPNIDPKLAYEAAVLTCINTAFQTAYRVADFQTHQSASGDKTESLRWGSRVANLVLNMRSTDGAREASNQIYAQHGRRRDNLGWEPTGPYFGAPAGVHIPLSRAPGLLPGWGYQSPWVIRTASQFRAGPFPEEGSPEFLRQARKVKELGGMDSAVRTADNAEVAFFWEDGPKGITPPGHWQLLALDIYQNRDMSFIDQARAAALLSVAQADGAICTWDTKYYHDIVRPETVIRSRAPSLATAELQALHDPTWKTLIPTPPFPAYTSGHSCFSAASARMIANIIGTDRVSFSGTAPDLINWLHQLRGVRRSWTSLSQAAEEGGMSREYGGIHWESDNTEGLIAGRALSDHVFASAFQHV